MADVATGEEERKIIVAVDESEESLHALRWCLNNIVAAGRARDTLVLLYARPLPPVHSLLDGVEYVFSEDVTASMDRCGKELARSVLTKAETICQSYNNAQIKVEAKECGGDARDVICDMVDRLGADILVVGSHGYGFIKRTLIGSVSDYCVRYAKCPVIIVKRQA